MGSSASTGESGANAAISEAIRQWAREQLVDEVERINAAREERCEGAEIDTAAITAIKQWIKDLRAAVEQINGSRGDGRLTRR